MLSKHMGITKQLHLQHSVLFKIVFFQLFLLWVSTAKHLISISLVTRSDMVIWFLCAIHLTTPWGGYTLCWCEESHTGRTFKHRKTGDRPGFQPKSHWGNSTNHYTSVLPLNGILHFEGLSNIRNWIYQHIKNVFHLFCVGLAYSLFEMLFG